MNYRLTMYKLKWKYRNERTLVPDKYTEVSIYKEFIFNEDSYLILKSKFNNKQLKYICNKWNGQRWCTIAVKNNPRIAIDKIKELASREEE